MGYLLSAGAMPSVSVDYPTVPASPALQISICMARHDPGKAPESPGTEEEKLTLEQAIEA